MRFKTTVMLPRGSKAFPTKIRGLFSDLTDTSLKIPDLSDISFHGVCLLNKNGGIDVGVSPFETLLRQQQLI